MIETEEIIEVVVEMNSRFQEDGDFYSFFNYYNDGTTEAIQFSNICLWHSEDDERRYIDEDETKQESLLEFIERKYKELISYCNQGLLNKEKNNLIDLYKNLVIMDSYNEDKLISSSISLIEDLSEQLNIKLR